MKKLSIIKLVFTSCLLVVALISSVAKAIDLFADPQPQAQKNTCQSYAIMLALAAQGDPNFPINNFSELRSAETSFRQVSEQVPGGPYGHEALKTAISQYTQGKYVLKIENFPDIVGWTTRVKALTNLKSSVDVLIAQLTGKHFPVLLTSVMKFGNSNYPDGHIFSVLGLAGSGLNSNTEIVAFNSAIKGGGAINRCEPGTQPGDMRYTAGVVSTNDYQLKSYGGTYRILYLVKN